MFHILTKFHGKNYLFLNLLSVIIFTLLYSFYPREENEQTENIHANFFSKLIYCFWFSLVTQTTVGYGDIRKNGKSIYFNEASFYFKIINILQLLSVFFIAAYLQQ